MIFVTVGTTAFEGLIRAADELGVVEEVVVQKADGGYSPSNCEYFDYSDQFDQYIEAAEIVVTHGGAGTLLQLIGGGKRVVGVANDERDDLHQSDLLGKLSDDGYIIWCRDLARLAESIQEARGYRFAEYTKPQCDIAMQIARDFG